MRRRNPLDASDSPLLAGLHKALGSWSALLCSQCAFNQEHQLAVGGRQPVERVERGLMIDRAMIAKDGQINRALSGGEGQECDWTRGSMNQYGRRARLGTADDGQSLNRLAKPGPNDGCN